jgi:hypothetical protein
VKTFSSTRGQWTWATNHEFSAGDKPPASYPLSAGIHVLEISGRSRNFSLDRFHLYLDGVTNPLDETRPPSTTAGGGGGGGAAPPPVTALALINADTDQPLAGFADLRSGAVLNLGTLPTRNLNLRAETDSSAVGSVVFGYDGNPAYRVENGAPYALAGDTAGDFNAWTPTVGSHSVSATPWSASGGTGTAGTARLATFTVVDDPTTPTTNGGGGGGGGGGGARRENANGDAGCLGQVSGSLPSGLLWLALSAAACLAFRRRP